MTKTITTKPSLSKDMYYGMLFNQITIGSSWLKNMAFAPGGWAVDYCFLYTMYRALNACKPKHIIELGLGQTTHMLSQYRYLAENPCDLYTYEHDKDWVNFFITQSNVPLDIEVCNLLKNQKLTIGNDTYEGVNLYDNFLKLAKRCNNYDFVVIDAPFGTKPYSRVHLLELIENELINKETFVIMLDDMNRSGEQATFEKSKELLKKHGYLFKSQIYSGEKEHGIIVSENLKFLTTM